MCSNRVSRASPRAVLGIGSLCTDSSYEAIKGMRNEIVDDPAEHEVGVDASDLMMLGVARSSVLLAPAENALPETGREM